MTPAEYATLREVDIRIAALEKATCLKISALEKATCLAAETMDKRLEGMNEFRAALKDQNSTFLSRNEYIIQHEKLEADIRMLREAKAMLEGKASQQAVNISMAIAIAGLLLSAVAVFH